MARVPARGQPPDGQLQLVPVRPREADAPLKLAVSHFGERRAQARLGGPYALLMPVTPWSAAVIPLVTADALPGSALLGRTAILGGTGIFGGTAV